MFPKIVVPPNHPWINRVFHYFHHPFWGYHYFWKHPHVYLYVSWVISAPQLVDIRLVQKVNDCQLGAPVHHGRFLQKKNGHFVDKQL